jgi:ankyrin repeat protein/WD40 repeat protein
MIRWKRHQGSSGVATADAAVQGTAESDDGPSYEFDAFVSYSGSSDYHLARRVERFLETFYKLPKPKHELRRLKVCVDGSDFSARPAGVVTGKQEQAKAESIIANYLERSRYLLVLCSPPACNSEWVDFEIGWFLQHRDPGAIRLVVTEGDPKGDAAHVFPAKLIEAGLHRGIWYDLRRERAKFFGRTQLRPVGEQLTILAAHLYSGSKEDFLPVWYETERQTQRRRLRAASASAVILAALALVTLRFAMSSQRTLIDNEVANGLRQMNDGDEFGALLWFADSLRLETSILQRFWWKVREWPHRFRIGSCVANSPSLISAWDIGRSLAIVSNDSSMLATASGSTVSVWSLPAGKLLTSSLANPGQVLKIAFSGDDHLLTAVTPTAICTWNLQPGADFAKQIGPAVSGEFGIAKLSPGGTLAAIFSRTGLEIVPTRSEVGRPQRLVDGELVSNVWFGGNGERLAASCARSVDVWESGQYQRLQRISLVGNVEWVAFSADNARLVTISGEFFSARTATVWDVSSGERIGPGFTYQSKLVKARFSPDGETLLIASQEGTAWLINVKTGQVQGSPMRHRKELQDADFASSGDAVFTRGNDGVRIWDMQGSAIIPWLERESWPTDTFVLDYGMLTISAGGLVKLWGYPESPQSFSVGDRSTQVTSIAGHPTGSLVALGFGQDLKDLVKPPHASQDTRFIRLWDVSVFQRSADLQLPAESKMGYLRFSDDGQLLFSATDDGHLGVWQTSTDAAIPPALPSCDAGMQSFAFSSDGRRLALVERGERAITIIDRPTDNRRKPKGPTGAFRMAFSPNGKTLAAIQNPHGALAGAIVETESKLWLIDVESAEIREEIQLKGFLTDVAFAPGGRRIVVSGFSHTDSEKGSWLISLSGITVPAWVKAKLSGSLAKWASPYRVTALPAASVIGFAADGDRFAIGWTGGVTTRHSNTGQAIGPALPHRRLPKQIMFRDHDRVLATRESDDDEGENSALMWDSVTGLPLFRPMQHTGAKLHALAVLPDARKAITCGDKGQIRIWDMTLEDAPITSTLRRTELLAGRQLAKTGDQRPLDKAEWLNLWSRILEEEEALPAFNRAIRAKDEDRALKILEREPGLPKLASKNDLTPLHSAAGNGFVRTVEALLKHGAAPDRCLKSGETPLHAAALGGHLEVMRLLKSAGANIDAAAGGKTPLHMAISVGHEEAAKFLVEQGANCNAVTLDGDSEVPLHAAAMFGNANIVKLLIDHGANLDAAMTGRFAGVTPLHLAIARQHHDAARLLLSSGADPKRRGTYGNAIEIARSSGDAAMIAIVEESD